tara:strand:- start:907 stop:1011 length:105 start_codon:yes stop_codon:yes gene_type:complete
MSDPVIWVIAAFERFMWSMSSTDTYLVVPVPGVW